ncbi:hypothetical protein N0V88_006606 [Collariella sp. IMI 366227]|nr:hypothetical protein N0V88_006606 [Collariella sp. IMI 366227]
MLPATRELAIALLLAAPKSTITNTTRAPTVAKHTSPESCWVVLHGNVYDVTEFLPEHPGGSKIILQLAGRDATAEYDPIHPSGILEENLKPEAKLGVVDAESLQKMQRQSAAGREPEEQRAPPPPLHQLLNLDEIEAAAKTQVSKKCWAYYFSASDDMQTKYLNNAAYRSILLRPRIFVDVTRADTTTTLLGNKVGTPSSSALPPWRASPTPTAKPASHIVANSAPDQIFGWQLYVQNNRAKSEAMLKRIAALPDKYKFIVLTLDAPDFEVLQSEIETCMKMLGVKDLSELGPRFINSRAVERDIFDGGAGLDRAGLWTSPAAKL